MRIFYCSFYRYACISRRPNSLLLQQNTGWWICATGQRDRRAVYRTMLWERFTLHPVSCGGIWQKTGCQQIRARYVKALQIWKQGVCEETPHPGTKLVIKVIKINSVAYTWIIGVHESHSLVIVIRFFFCKYTVRIYM